MTFLLMFVVVLHLITLVMLFIATTAKSWLVLSRENSDLWYNCMFDNNSETWICASNKNVEWLQAVQALMVLSVVFSCIAFLVFLAQLFTMSKGGLFYITGFCQIIAGLMVFSAVLTYTLHHGQIQLNTKMDTVGHYGYCYILAWVCFPLLLAGGIIYIHLRKKE